MELITKKSFLRDWDNIGSKDLNRSIEDLVKKKLRGTINFRNFKNKTSQKPPS